MSARRKPELAAGSEQDEAAFFASAFPEAAPAKPRLRSRPMRATDANFDAHAPPDAEASADFDAHASPNATASADFDAHAQPAALRLFFALPLSDELRAQVAGVVNALRACERGAAVRWVRAANLHITLRFLGRVAAARVPALAEAATDALRAAAPIEFALSAPQLFPSARAPKVVALTCEPEAPLAALAACLDAAFLEAGCAAKRAQNFRPHITLGRLRTRRAPKLTAAALPALPVFRARCVQLFQSELTQAGARYHALESFALKASATAAHSAQPVSNPHPTNQTQTETENDHAQE